MMSTSMTSKQTNFIFSEKMSIDAPTVIVNGRGDKEQNNNFSAANVLKLTDSRSVCWDFFHFKGNEGTGVYKS